MEEAEVAVDRARVRGRRWALRIGLKKRVILFYTYEYRGYRQNTLNGCQLKGIEARKWLIYSGVCRETSALEKPTCRQKADINISVQLGP